MTERKAECVPLLFPTGAWVLGGIAFVVVAWVYGTIAVINWPPSW